MFESLWITTSVVFTMGGVGVDLFSCDCCCCIGGGEAGAGGAT